MIDKTKLGKFMKRLDGLIVRLDRQNELVICQKINQSYYVQKRDQLRLLLEQFEEEEKRVEELADQIREDYKIAFNQWCTDMRWLNGYKRNQNSKAVL